MTGQAQPLHQQRDLSLPLHYNWQTVCKKADMMHIDDETWKIKLLRYMDNCAGYLL